jgi:hypothetical protein
MAKRGLMDMFTVCARSLPWFERARAPGGSWDPWMGRHLVLASHLHLAPGELPSLDHFEDTPAVLCHWL